jgi:hypothetical protein
MTRLTNSLRDLGHELVQTRLWPVALALAVALVAVPVLLSKSASNPGPSTAVVPAASTGAGAPGSPFAAFTPAVSGSGPKSSDIRKKLRGFDRKNPFTPRGDQTPPRSTTAGDAQPLGAGNATPAAGSGEGAVSTGQSGSGAGSTTGTTGTTGSTEKTFYTYTAEVRFGEVGSVKSKTLERFRALPSSDNPIVIFMGVKTDGKTAVFMVSSEATTTGDGRCEPSESSCLFLYMKKGDEQTIEAIDSNGDITTYQLELRDINVKTLDKAASGSSVNSSRASSRSSLRSASHGARRARARVVRSFDVVGF